MNEKTASSTETISGITYNGSKDDDRSYDTKDSSDQGTYYSSNEGSDQGTYYSSNTALSERYTPQEEKGLVADYEDAFELTGQGPFNYVALLASCLIFMYCSLEMAGMAYVLTPAECDLKLTVTQKSLVNSAILIGIVTTSICWGLLSDRYGRRVVMLPTVLGTVITSFLSSICTSFWFMFPLRVFAGAQVSAATAVVLVYVSELHTLSKSEFALSMAITSDQINFIVIPGIAYLIIRGEWSFHMGHIEIKPWRVFMWSWGFLGITGAVLLFFLPESPRFVLASKGAQKAIPILAKIYACNHRKKPSDYPIGRVTTKSEILPTSEEPTLKVFLKDISQLLRAPMRRCYIITHYCMFMTFLLANGIYIWMPAFINDALRDSNQKNSICGLINEIYIQEGPESFNDPQHDFVDRNCDGDFNTLMYPLSMAMELAVLGPYIIVMYFINKVNLQRMYASIALMNVIGLSVSSVYPQIIVAMISLIIGLSGGCLVSIISVLAVEAFPTNLRALAMCTLYMVGQLGAIIGVNTIGFMRGPMCYVLFAVFIGLLFLSAITLLFLWPDMRKVREEMESLHFCY